MKTSSRICDRYSHGMVKGVFLALLFPWGLACAGGTGEEDDTFFTGPTMQPGANCRSCHGAPSSPYPEAPAWSVAGTVFEGPESDIGVEGVSVVIRDVNGKTEELLTNSVGNFYTQEHFESPYSVTLEKDGVSVNMPAPPPSGGCNACHNQPTVGGAPGRLYLPSDGRYDSLAECEESTLLVGSTRYPCAPFACQPKTDEASAYCHSTCVTDDQCSEGSCQQGSCGAD